MQQEVDIEAKVEPALPVVLADLVQIGRSAEPATECDGGDGSGHERRSIIIEVRCTAKHAIEVSVADSGPGVAPR